VRFYDFCKGMFLRARLRTTRTSRTAELVVGTIAGRLKVAFQLAATAEGTQGQGSRNRISTLTIGIAHDGDFAPTPIASGTSCRDHRSSPCPERRGWRTASPSSRMLAPQTRREGRATPDFREEVRRSPTRGAFR